jgi:hypothetical protein
MKNINRLVSHDRLQSECYQWHHNTYPEDRGFVRLIYSNPRNQINGKLLQAMGLIPGTPDQVWWRKGNDVYFEFKVKPDRVSKQQAETHDLLKSIGKHVWIVWNLEDYKDIVRSYKED